MCTMCANTLLFAQVIKSHFCKSMYYMPHFYLKIHLMQQQQSMPPSHSGTSLGGPGEDTEISTTRGLPISSLPSRTEEKALGPPRKQ